MQQGKKQSFFHSFFWCSHFWHKMKKKKLKSPEYFAWLYPIFFSAKREKFCCLNQRRILRKFFQTKQPFAKSFSFFVSNEAPMSCFLTLHFNIFFRKWILHLAESLCNKEKQQHAEYLFAVSRKRKLILQQKL